MSVSSSDRGRAGSGRPGLPNVTRRTFRLGWVTFGLVCGPFVTRPARGGGYVTFGPPRVWALVLEMPLAQAPGKTMRAGRRPSTQRPQNPAAA